MNLTELSLLLAGTAHSGVALLGWQLYRVKRKHAKRRQRNEQCLAELRGSLKRSADRAENLAKLVGGLREQVCTQSERVQQIEQQDPRKLPISQAAKLASLGTSGQQLAKACGLSRSEAELLAKLHATRPSQEPIPTLQKAALA